MRAGALYARYEAWAEGGNEFVISQTVFGESLVRRGFGVSKARGLGERLGVRQVGWTPLPFASAVPMARRTWRLPRHTVFRMMRGAPAIRYHPV